MWNTRLTKFLCVVGATGCTPVPQSEGVKVLAERVEAPSAEQRELSAHFDLPFDIVVDSNNCPRPGKNRVSPRGLELYEMALQRQMGLGSRRQVAELLIDASFETPVSVALERSGGSTGRECEGGCELVIVALQESLWGKMMGEMRRQQGRVMCLGLEHQAAALADLEVGVDTVRIPVEQTLAVRLLGVWNEVLLRTAYPRERLVGPDGSGLAFVKMDGTRYEFASRGMAGETHSPRSGSLMREYVELGTKLAEARRTRDGAFWSEVTRRVASLESRLLQDEPCEILVPANR